MCEHPENDANEIIPNLWLGNIKAAYNQEFLKTYNIKNVLTIMDDFDNKYKYNSITYLVIPIKDEHSCSKDMINIFNIATNFIYNSLQNNEPILVHCKKGHHRSAALVVAFLIKYLNVDYLLALRYINYLRPCAVRRNTCMGNHLFKYYLHINNIKTCKIECNISNKVYNCKCKK
ncbi:dual specificity phosphatase [Fadolivirus algeromassiliense]|jgi:dual specificity phosphatase 12|uniref:Dual specificity phosphatase n=1 Tax=Fadolivirus FV1/VV64 TaxID=3070911 RepID=A0A7D3UUC3_9VIRU|nr:dual specificity phosphatase [Fadolivirus algeromassiliense]QKF94051.1 dual specificity phosphatase [Fadolivirus FV1/VV64]